MMHQLSSSCDIDDASCLSPPPPSDFSKQFHGNNNNDNAVRVTISNSKKAKVQTRNTESFNNDSFNNSNNVNIFINDTETAKAMMNLIPLLVSGTPSHKRKLTEIVADDINMNKLRKTIRDGGVTAAKLYHANSNNKKKNNNNKKQSDFEFVHDNINYNNVSVMNKSAPTPFVSFRRIYEQNIINNNSDSPLSPIELERNDKENKNKSEDIIMTANNTDTYSWTDILTEIASDDDEQTLPLNKTHKIVHGPVSNELRTNNKPLSDDECIQINKNKIKNNLSHKNVLNESQSIPPKINNDTYKNNISKAKQKPKPNTNTKKPTKTKSKPETDDSNQKKLSPIDQIAKCQEIYQFSKTQIEYHRDRLDGTAKYGVKVAVNNKADRWFPGYKCVDKCDDKVFPLECKICGLCGKKVSDIRNDVNSHIFHYLNLNQKGKKIETMNHCRTYRQEIYDNDGKLTGYKCIFSSMCASETFKTVGIYHNHFKMHKT